MSEFAFSSRLETPKLDNGNGTFFDELLTRFLQDGELSSPERYALQEVYNDDINKLTNNIQREIRELAFDQGLDIYSSWKQSEENTTPTLERNGDGFTYTVQPGERLWKIVAGHYELEDRLSIIQAINYVVDQQEPGAMAKRLGQDTKPDNFPDGVKGDRLWVGDKITLPVLPNFITRKGQNEKPLN